MPRYPPSRKPLATPCGPLRGWAVRSPAITFPNPHAAPYAFPAGKHPALSDYLNENTEYDPASGCLLWAGGLTKEGTGRATRSIATQYGTQQASRLAWMAGHGKKPDKGTQLIHRCGNHRCIHPHHLKEAEPNDLWYDPDLGPPRRRGSVGALKAGKRVLWAQEVYQIQSVRLPRDPSLGLPWAFRCEFGFWFTERPRLVDLRPHHLHKLEVIRAVRRCPIRAALTELPCGFRRYDLPAGITEIAFTEPPPAEYVPLWSDDDDDDPEAAPEAVWALAA